MTPDALFNQLRYLQELYTQRYEVLESEIATYSMAINAVERNIQTLEGTAQLENTSILVGESGMYLNAAVKKIEKIITYIGAGYLVEKSVDEAKDFMKVNSDKHKEGMKKLTAEKQKIEKELVSISYKLSELQNR